MTVERTDHEPGAVQIKQRRIPIRLRRRGPLCASPVRVHRLDGDVLRHAVLKAACVDVLAMLSVVVRTRPAGQFRSECDDLEIVPFELPDLNLPPIWNETSLRSSDNESRAAPVSTSIAKRAHRLFRA